MAKWNIEDDGINDAEIKSESGTVAIIASGGKDGKANARLIAAAPELLEAAQAVVNDHMFADIPESHKRAIIALSEAVARACAKQVRCPVCGERSDSQDWVSA